jgi:hypothetical protein
MCCEGGVVSTISVEMLTLDRLGIGFYEPFLSGHKLALRISKFVESATHARSQQFAAGQKRNC